jgi:hypothetical protein
MLLGPLLNSVQPGAIHGDLIINLVCLACDPLNVLVLCVHLVTHRATELVEAPRCAVEGI